MESTLRMPTKHVFKNSINVYISCSRNNGTSKQLINLPVGLLKLDLLLFLHPSCIDINHRNPTRGLDAFREYSKNAYKTCVQKFNQ